MPSIWDQLYQGEGSQRYIQPLQQPPSLLNDLLFGVLNGQFFTPPPAALGPSGSTGGGASDLPGPVFNDDTGNGGSIDIGDPPPPSSQPPIVAPGGGSPQPAPPVFNNPPGGPVDIGDPPPPPRQMQQSMPVPATPSPIFNTMDGGIGIGDVRHDPRLAQSMILPTGMNLNGLPNFTPPTIQPSPAIVSPSRTMASINTDHTPKGISRQKKVRE